MNTPYSKKCKENGIDLSIDNRFKYAIFLNFMPYSFLNSRLSNYRINSVKLVFQFNLFGIENIIYKDEYNIINNVIDPKIFANLFNSFAQENKSIYELCGLIYKKINRNISENSIYEYMGRMIEFALSKGAVIYN